MSVSNRLDISDELCVYRFGNGIKLIRPDQTNKQYPTAFIRNTGHTVKSFLKLPLSIGFVNTENAIQVVNEESAASLNFASTKEAEGKSIFDVASTSSAQTVVNNYKKVFKENKLKIQEEHLLLKNENHMHRILIHLPVYNNENKIVGLTGCTIVLGRHLLADSLNLAVQLGLLNPCDSISDHINYMPGKNILDVYLSKRETECLNYYVHGKSARVISVILGISKRTVETYLQNIKIKMCVTTKSELIEKVMKRFTSI